MSTKEQSPMTEKESVRWRVANAHIDPDNYVFIPAKKQADYYDNDIPHGLRHTCGSLMVEHGVDPETVKTVLGHESLKTTNRYLHPYAESMKDASEKMERIIRGKTDGEIEIHLSSGE